MTEPTDNSPSGGEYSLDEELRKTCEQLVANLQKLGEELEQSLRPFVEAVAPLAPVLVALLWKDPRPYMNEPPEPDH